MNQESLSSRPHPNSSLQQALKDPRLSLKISTELSAQGISSESPTLKLELQGPTFENMPITESDALKVFTQFGEVTALETKKSAVLATFASATSAYFAHKVLNGKFLSENGSFLVVSWEQTVPGNQDNGAADVKYNCKFAVEINAEDFPVSRRIIGPKGANMKRIIDACTQGHSGNIHDIIKIRLRGRGSGHREGPERVESEEPLHICISSRYEDKYKLAVELVEQLLKDVYREYRERCQGASGPISIKMNENVTGRTNRHSAEVIQRLELKPTLSTKEVNELIDIRNESRKQCNFALADSIRAMMRAKGVVLVDGKGARGRANEVTTWKHSDQGE